MRFFETRYGGGVGQETVQVHPYQEALWAKALGVDTLDNLFDLETSANAIKVLDQAINMFNHEPDNLRPLLDANDPIGLRGNRMVFEQMRRTLAEHSDASISGVVDDAATQAAVAEQVTDTTTTPDSSTTGDPGTAANTGDPITS
jgi:hypothetical protein